MDKNEVLCIKDVNFNEKDERFKCGCIYLIKEYSRHKGLPCIAVFSDVIQYDGDRSSVAFYTEYKIREFYKFSEHFITLAEYREQQINSILND